MEELEDKFVTFSQISLLTENDLHNIWMQNNHCLNVEENNTVAGDQHKKLYTDV